MKKISSIILTCIVALFCATSCMNDFDAPNMDSLTFGNNSIGSATTTIAQFKSKYLSTTKVNGLKQITDSTVIEGVVIGDDEAGNIYKQLIVRDSTGAIVVTIDNSGLYANCPVGQKVAINCTGLYVGGYGYMAQIGCNNNGAIGRMPIDTWKKHVRNIGAPSTTYSELTPVDIDGNWLQSQDKNVWAPMLVKIAGKINDANGKNLYAPKADADAGNGVNRTFRYTGGSVTLRTSSYATFAKDTMPTGNVVLTGILTRYTGSWQLQIRSAKDVVKQ